MIEINAILNIKEEITREEVDGVNIVYIEGTNQQYAISKGGAVYSFSYKMNGKSIGALGPGGYLTVNIQYVEEDPFTGLPKTHRKVEYIHRLMAKAFMTPVPGKPFVHHINEDKADNRLENLSFSNSRENANSENRNIKLAAAIKEYYKKRNVFDKRVKRVKVFDKEGKLLSIEPSIQAAADYIMRLSGKSNNSSSVQISAILQNKPGFKSVGGYTVKEAKEDEYQAWVVDHMNSLLEDETIEVSDIQLNKLSKIDGVKIINRRMNVETGEMEYEVREFNKGQKLLNELH